MKSVKQELVCVSEKVEALIAEEEAMSVFPLKKVSRWDSLYEESEEEQEARKQFVYNHVFGKDLLDIPSVEAHEIRRFVKANWFTRPENNDAISFAFGSMDYLKDVPETNNKKKWVKSILKRVEDLAVLHSCISSEKGRAEVYRKYRTLVYNTFTWPVYNALEEIKLIKAKIVQNNSIINEMLLNSKGNVLFPLTEAYSFQVRLREEEPELQKAFRYYKRVLRSYRKKYRGEDGNFYSAKKLAEISWRAKSPPAGMNE